MRIHHPLLPHLPPRRRRIHLYQIWRKMIRKVKTVSGLINDSILAAVAVLVIRWETMSMSLLLFKNRFLTVGDKIQ